MNQTKLFVSLSLLLLLGSLAFNFFSYTRDKTLLIENLEREGRQLHRSYLISLDTTYSSLSKIARLVALDPEVRKLLTKGSDAVIAEGGGAGGPQAAFYRSTLYEHLRPAWDDLTPDGIRQLHFHLAPGDTSFLRVHKPDRFGDDLSALRHIIVDVNSDLQPREGFELGRVYAGLRSVVPIFSTEASGMRHIGALEAGASFDEIIAELKRNIDADVAVLVRKPRVDKAVWEPSDDGVSAPCDCFVEASSSESLDWLANGSERLKQPLSADMPPYTEIVDTQQGSIAVTLFPLQDYLGKRDGDERALGKIVIWQGVSEQVVQLWRNVFIYLGYSVAGFLIFELVLFFGLRLVFNRLENEIQERTQSIRLLNSRLEEMSITDPLTGLMNRRALDMRLDQEFERSAREGTELSLLMIDLDYFKSINDRYGHQVGDLVLQELGRVLKEQHRSYDFIGRFGGEEFVVLLIGAGIEQARGVAEKLRKVVMTSIVVPEFRGRTVTCSIGVSSSLGKKRYENMISRADQALYRAKANGRNRVEVSE